jgi:hypothetical protein
LSRNLLVTQPFVTQSSQATLEITKQNPVLARVEEKRSPLTNLDPSSAAASVCFLAMAKSKSMGNVPAP